MGVGTQTRTVDPMEKRERSRVFSTAAVGVVTAPEEDPEEADEEEVIVAQECTVQS